MNKLLTLLAVCICCISILGLKLRLDIYVHDKNEVITTMEPEKNIVPGKAEESSGFWSFLYKPAPSLKRLERERAEREAKAKQQAQQQSKVEPEPPIERFNNQYDELVAIAQEMVANKEIPYRTASDDLVLFRLGQLQNDLKNGDTRQAIAKSLRKKYSKGVAPTYGDMLKLYFAEGGIRSSSFNKLLGNILNYITPLIVPTDGYLDPSDYSTDIRERLKKLYSKVDQIYSSTAPFEDRIEQFKALIEDPDFAEFYGAGRKGEEEIYNLTGKYTPAPDSYITSDHNDEEVKYSVVYPEILKKANDIHLSADDDTTKPIGLVPRRDIVLKTILENAENQENPENQEGEVVETPEGESINPQEDTLPTQDTQSVQGYQDTPNGIGAILNTASSNAGPMYALNTTSGLYGEKYEALAKALRAYALKNGIVTDTPKDPESFKPYIPDFYV